MTSITTVGPWAMATGGGVMDHAPGQRLRSGAAADVADTEDETLWKRVASTLSAEELGTLFDKAPFPVTVTYYGGRLIYVNDAMCKLMGKPRDVILQMRPADFFANPDEVKAYERANKEDRIKDYLVRLKIAERVHRVRADASTLQVGDDGRKVSIIFLHDVERELSDREALEQAHTQLEAAYREVQQAQARIVQSEKMAALGTLIAGIAHEFNTPLGSINSAASTLARAAERAAALSTRAEEVGMPEVARLARALPQLTQAVHAGGERLSALVERLKRFARLDEAERKRVQGAECVRDSIEMLRPRLPAEVELSVSCDDDTVLVCDPGSVNQAVFNLLLNALEAIDGPGRIHVEARREQDAIHIRVQDSGRGIPERDHDKVLEPRFTTKGTRVGIGLGLPTCVQIASDHGGTLYFESTPGSGSTFTLELPAGDG